MEKQLQLQSSASASSSSQSQSPPRCAICGTMQQLMRCAKCKAVYYCSPSHQHMDWPKHKQTCRLLARQKNNNKMQQLQQAVAATTLSNPLNNYAPNQVVSSVGAANVTNGGCDNNTASLLAAPLTSIESSARATVEPMSVILGTNETEIMNSQAESVSQNRNSNYHGNVDANSTTMEQMQFRAASGEHGAAERIGEDDGFSLTLPQQLLNDNTQMPINQNNHNPQQQHHHHHQHHQHHQHHTHHSYQPQEQQHQQQQQQQQQQHQLPHQYEQQQRHHQYNQHNGQSEKSISCQIGRCDENAIGNANERRYEDLCRNIINDMNQYGLSVVDDFLGMEKGLQILNEVHRMYAAGVFKDGQLVNNARVEQDLHRIRGDKITWVKGVEPGCSNVGYLINQIDAVICRANTMKNNGKLGHYNIKERTKAMVACYPGSGSHYVMHVDNPNKDGRVITAIYYLNVNWDTRRSGGVLRIFPEHGNSVADIEPKFDRLIFFWSDKRNPHEVQPAHRTRYAITVWYFDADEREQALNRCKHKKIVNTTTTTTAAVLRAAAAPVANSTTLPPNSPNTNSALNAKTLQYNTVTTTTAAAAAAAAVVAATSPNSNSNSNSNTITNSNASEICT